MVQLNPSIQTIKGGNHLDLATTTTTYSRMRVIATEIQWKLMKMKELVFVRSTLRKLVPVASTDETEVEGQQLR
jgi:hypothetical protein